MSETSVSLIVDKHKCETAGVKTGVLQRSPVSPILFAIYISRIFTEVKEKVE